MKLISVIIFYSEKPADASMQEKSLVRRLPEKETKLGNRILQMKFELANFPFGKEYAAKFKFRNSEVLEEYQLDLESQSTGNATLRELTTQEVDPVLVPPPIKLKSECCEKYLKGKRCGRCPCFDLPNGPASWMN